MEEGGAVEGGAWWVEKVGKRTGSTKMRKDSNWNEFEGQRENQIGIKLGLAKLVVKLRKRKDARFAM